MPKRVIVLAIAALVVVAGGCGDGDSGGGVTTAPPADVAGKWLLTTMNPLSARYINCTGDALVVDDATIWIASDGVTCNYWESLLAVQTDSEFSFDSVNYACSDGWSGTARGGGTVVGNQITGHLHLVSDRGWTGTEYFSGSVAGGLIALGSSRVEWTGTIEGECDISPELEYQGEIREADRSVQLQ